MATNGALQCCTTVDRSPRHSRPSRRNAGAVLQFDRQLRSLEELGDVDLIVGADGLNSLVRRTYEGDFATSLSYLDSKFVWYGTTNLSDPDADIR